MSKYKRGKKIRTVAQFEASKCKCFWVIFGTPKVMPYGFIQAWQYGYLKDIIYGGRMYEANLREGAKK